MTRHYKSILILLAAVVSLVAMSSQFADEVEDSKFLVDQLAELESHIANRDQLSPEVSKVDVAWHLDHMLKVANGIYDSLEVSDVNRSTLNVNPLRLLVWTTGKMSRGVGKAPSYVTPPDQINTEDIYSQLKEARGKMEQVHTLPEKANFEHFAFGVLDRENAMRFIEIHTNHHLSIIRDILLNGSTSDAGS